MLIAQAIIDVTTRAFEHPFDYLVPVQLEGEVSVGCAVSVDFNNRAAVAYVTDIVTTTQVTVGRLKPIRAVLGGPYFDEIAARTAAWIASEYVAPLSDALHLLTPPGPASKVVRHVGSDGSVTWEVIAREMTQVDDRWVHLTPAGRNYEPPHNALRQREVVAALRAGEMRVPELALDGATSVSSVLKTLERRGVVEVEERRRIRGATPLPVQVGDDVMLTQGQTDALAAIGEAVVARKGDVVVLDGITGSGKTEVYLRAVRHVLEQGGGAIVLVPEISLTPQTVGRFRARFGDQVAVLHSRLSVGERYDQWGLLQAGMARVVVGARSALFAPVADVRLIVIDEEHEGSYKQDSSPRYLARDVAAYMVRQRGAALVLGSATPSIETLRRCEEGSWRRVEMPERPSGRPLPPVTVVDMGAEFAKGHRSMFSPTLVDALLETVGRDEKAVLLYNRRGFASFLECRACGYVPRCEQCSTSLTYHDQGNELVCHQCGRRYPAPALCPSCGSPYLRKLGAGTERVQGELNALFREHLGDDVAASIPVVRMDADSVRALGKGGHATLLDGFIAAPRGVLLGTQMIAKGLDFPDVTLAAVLNADTALNLPDFRSGERTFQLIEQVAGRAGRADKPGRVIVQTYWPTHPAIRAGAAHDRDIFLAADLPERELLGYPPYRRLANLLLWGGDQSVVTRVAQELASRLRELVSQGSGPSTTVLDFGPEARIGSIGVNDGTWQVLGPSPCVIERRKGVWRWHILVKAPIGADLPGLLGRAMRLHKPMEGVFTAVDIDPINLF